MSSERGHRQFDHTADVALELWGPTEEAILVEGARGLVGLMTEDATLGSQDTRELTLSDCLDPVERLVQWMNEIIYLAVYERFFVTDADIELEDAGLSALLRGEQATRETLRGELKSATYHDLYFEQEEEALWRARVVIDV